MSGKGIDNSASQVPGNDGRYVIVVTRWNEEIVTGLLKGATQALAKAGIEGEQVEVVAVREGELFEVQRLLSGVKGDLGPSQVISACRLLEVQRLLLDRRQVAAAARGDDVGDAELDLLVDEPRHVHRRRLQRPRPRALRPPP